jgi:hypothetical protein
LNVFNGLDIHVLNNFADQHALTLLVGDIAFKYSFEQLAFLSPMIFSHFLEFNEPFQIKVPQEKTYEFIECFNKLNELFISSSSLQITQKNVSLLSSIAEALENSNLK